MKEYLQKFEKEVLIKIFETNFTRLPEPVPFNQKITKTKFGFFLDSSFDYNEVLAFDYYGLFKLSKGILKVKSRYSKTFPSIKIINAPVIHFSSIKKEQVQLLAPHLYKGFNDFKNYLVKLRWKGGQTIYEK